MEKRKIELAELDMEVQVAHSGAGSSTCTVQGKSTDCCWHDCTEYRDGGTGTAKWIDCDKWATYLWNVFS